MKTKLIMVLLAGASLVLGACGGGGGGGAAPAPAPAAPAGVALLQGTWKGALTYDPDTYFSDVLELQFDAAGKLTAAVLNGLPATVAGSATHDQGQLYTIIMSINGTNFSGGMMLSTAGKHLGVIIDGTGEYAVLEKDLTGSFKFEQGVFSITDITGKWSGYTVDTDSNGDVVKILNSNVDMTATGGQTLATFTGQDSDQQAFTGSILGYWDDIGTYRGNFISNTAGNLILVVSPDKQAVFSIACPGSNIIKYKIYYYNSCSYSVWSK